ncbi:MAG: hypothetical protein RLY71_509 [Pseudomonadota bacterium]|jgi:uncharacterized protein (DUF2252 family)
MTLVTDQIRAQSRAERQQAIIDSFVRNQGDLMRRDPKAWRGKFRKMAASPFAFYRGSASLFYGDISREQDQFLNEQTSRVWIQGDLHAENFGTYMNDAGVLVFDVNDFDEAYVGPFTWDVKRLAASLALIGHQKALSDAEIHRLIDTCARAYADQIQRFNQGKDQDFAITLSTATGRVRQVVQDARQLTRVDLLDRDTEIVDGDRRFRLGKSADRLDDATLAKVKDALAGYVASIPDAKRRNAMAYAVKDVVQRRGVGIGSAGLLMFSVLIEGETQALENDIIIGLKVAQPAAPSRYVPDERVRNYFTHDGQRTAVSQLALQAHADPLLGHALFDGQGMYVSEVSPYTADLEWDDINDLDELQEVVTVLGRCVAKIHSCSDVDSNQTLITYSTELAIHGVLEGRVDEFAAHVCDFGQNYGEVVRDDHRMFVDAFRNGLFGL